MKDRYIELDLLRTLAILMMIVYHLAYDLELYYGWKLGIFGNAGWILLRQSTAALFLLLVGCSFTISWKRHGEQHGGDSFVVRYRKYLLRGLGVIACGMLVTLVTFFWEPATYMRFGILHMIGASIILLPFFASVKEGNAVIGMMILGLGMIFPMTIGNAAPALLPFGLMSPDFASVDYFPLIPWFGAVLVGYATGHFLYVRLRWLGTSSLDSSVSSDSSHARSMRALAWPGRHALVIYLLHQPLLLLLLKLVMNF